MTDRTHSAKPPAAVIGCGKYFAKLRPSLSDYFELAALIDAPKGAVPFDLLNAVSASAPGAVFLLTPNALHAGQVVELAPLRCPVFVEKPLATTDLGLRMIRQSLSTNPRLYCSDFYPDIRARPIREWFGSDRSKPTGSLSIAGDRELWAAGPDAIGRIEQVSAVLLEGEGEAASFAQREWLWDPTHGGVLWDLAYHYLTLWSVLMNDPLELLGTAVEVARQAPTPQSAETNARLSLRSASGIDVTVHVGKYHEGPNERYFRLVGTEGTATMFFANPNVLTVETGAQTCTATLVADYYREVVHAFASYVHSGANHPHGLDAAVDAIELVRLAKRATSLSAVTE